MSNGRTLAADLESAIREATGTRFQIDDPGALAHAGSGNTTISDGSQKFFVKLVAQAQADRLAAEADGLAALRRAQAFRIPESVTLGENQSHAWLVLEWLDLRPISDAVTATRAAEALAELHRIEGQRFGWHRDNYIGPTPQANAPGDNWARFFALQRLKPQFDLAAARGYAGELRTQGERLVERLPALFLDHRPRPSLLHGDLWHGNLATLADGRPALYDPACYHGDREADIAMSELFGGLPSAFYVAYRRLMPVSCDYEARKLAYNLYHLLNHVNMFGRGYLGETQRCINRLSRELG